jgi:hypothetical protein
MDAGLKGQIDQRIGRNLLRYQMVETRLKAVLPLRHVTVSSEGLDVLARAVEGQKKWTLGKLVDAHGEAIETCCAESKAHFQERLQGFLDARNRLVHHLVQDHGGLRTREACEACIGRLDADYRLAEDVARQVHDVHRTIVESLASFVDAWAVAEPVPSGMSAMADRYAERLAERLGSDVQVELQVPPLEALTEILAGLERSHAREDGWTIFHPAGSELRRRYENVPGHLLNMAKQLDQYEFAQRNVREGAGTAWMFRRRAE